MELDNLCFGMIVVGNYQVVKCYFEQDYYYFKVEYYQQAADYQVVVLTFRYCPLNVFFITLCSNLAPEPILSIFSIPIGTFSGVFATSQSSPFFHTILAFPQLSYLFLIAIFDIPIPQFFSFTQVLNFLLLDPQFGLFICSIYSKFILFIAGVSTSIQSVLCYFLVIAKFVSFALINVTFLLSTFLSPCKVLIVVFMQNLLTRN